MKALLESSALRVTAVALGAISLGVLLFLTSLGSNPFIFFAVAAFILAPFRRESPLLSRLFTASVCIFALWLLKEVAAILLPFIVAFSLAFLLDPFVTWLQRKRLPRSVSATLIVIIGVSAFALISIFVFPLIFSQLNAVIRQLSSLVSDVANYFESRKFFRLLAGYGLNIDTLRDVVQTEIVPRIKGVFETIFQGLLTFLTNLSGVVSQVINVILIPILLFYFLKDFNRLKQFIAEILRGKNDKMLADLQRIHLIVRAYIGGQAIAAVLVAILSTLIFTMFGVPYGIVLGLISGIVNPIPYVGMFASMLIGSITVLIVGGDSALVHILTIVLTTIILHLLDNYVLQPRIVGERVGLHPLMLIASLFVFGYFFGILGLLIAVPTTAVLMMFFNDWLTKKNAEIVLPEVLFPEENTESV